MRRFCEIIPVLIVLVAAMGCRSHRTTVTHEAARYERAILDSGAVRVDTLRRVDSAAVHLLSQSVLLEWDSVDYRLVLDSAGRAIGVSGSRRTSRHSGSVSTSAMQSSQQASHAGKSMTTVQRDSVSHELSEVQQCESTAGSSVPWLKWAGIAACLFVGVSGIIYLRRLTERWSKR